MKFGVNSKEGNCYAKKKPVTFATGFIKIIKITPPISFLFSSAPLLNGTLFFALLYRVELSKYHRF